jgi:hypothetical protein
MSQGEWLLLARNGYMLDELEKFCLYQGFSFHSISRDPLKSPALAAVKVWETLRRGEVASPSQVMEMLRYMPPEYYGSAIKPKMKTLGKKDLVKMSDLVALGLRTQDIWHRVLRKISPAERDFFIAARKRGEALLKQPRIKISTIHAAKGGEADNVVLMSDMSYRCYENMTRKPDDEIRVWYVGMTRCRKTLNIVLPRTDLCFEV